MEQCDQCGHCAISYNSCRNRSCPKCQAAVRAKWLAEREAELLPVKEYFHVVFTLPQLIASLALQNARRIYSILFHAVAETLLTIAADPKHLGAAIGFLAVLHTWGQNLHLPPHIHCVVPGGGISPDQSRWIACRKSFFLPVRVLSRLFRKKFLIHLRKAFQKGKLQFNGQLKSLAQPAAFEALCQQAGRIEWVVYAKRPFGEPEQVLKYLARYTHRVAISNRRLISMADGRVTFEWKDYAGGNQTKTMTLEAVEFIRRFLSTCCPLALSTSATLDFWPTARARKSWRCAAPCCPPPKPPSRPAQVRLRPIQQPRNRCPAGARSARRDD